MPKETTSALLAACAVALGTSCASDDDRTSADLEPVPTIAASLAVEIGGGLDGFEALTDGAPVALVYGPQGGFHVWTAVRVRDVSVEQVQINVSSRYADGRGPAGPPARWAAKLSPRGDVREHAGMQNFIANAAGEVVGARIVLRAEVIAPDRRHGAAEVAVIPSFK
jgi:hypothetical protein